MATPPLNGTKCSSNSSSSSSSSSIGERTAPGVMSTADLMHQDTQLPLQQGTLSANLPPHGHGHPYRDNHLQLGLPHYVPRIFSDSPLNIAASRHGGVGVPMGSHLSLGERQFQHHYHHQLCEQQQQLQQLQHLQRLQQRLLAGDGATSIVSGSPGSTGIYHPNVSAWQQQQQQQSFDTPLPNMASGISAGLAAAPGSSGMMPNPPGGVAIGARGALPSQSAMAPLTEGLTGPWPSAPDWSHPVVEACKQIGMSHAQAGSQPPVNLHPQASAPPAALDEYHQHMLSCVGASFLLQQYEHHYQQQRQAAVTAAGLSVPAGCPGWQQQPPSSSPSAMSPLEMVGGQSSGGGAGGSGGLESLANACLQELHGGGRVGTGGPFPPLA